MGLGNYGSQVLYVAEGFTRQDVVEIGLRRRRMKESDPASVACPILDVDCNNVIYIVGRKAADPVLAVANHLKEWSQSGVIVVPICDGETRPVSKQATNKHRADREKSRFKAVLKRQELRDLSKKLEHDKLDAAERDTIKKTRDKVERTVKTSETQAANIVPTDFADKLGEALRGISAHESNNVRGTVTRVKTAKFQADGLMAGRYLSGQSHLLESTDGDFPAFLGDDCVSIKGFTGGTYSISCTSRKTLDDIISHLDPASQAKIKFKEPKTFHPIFEGIIDMRLRALIAVIIGCDVCPGGVKDVGPGKVAAQLELIREEGACEEFIYSQLMTYAVEMSKPSKKKPPQLSKEVLSTFVDSILYEPTNEEPLHKSPYTNPHTYLKEAPKILTKYNEEFKAQTTVIEDGPDIAECKGCYGDGSARHNFLAAVDHYQCKGCSETICRLCTESIGKDQFCLPCYIVESLIPGVEVSDLMTVSEMRDELKNKYKFDYAEKLSVQEVEDAWASHTLHRTIEESCGAVKFPVLPASSIEKGDAWEELAEIDFSFGGSFLLKDDIHERHMPAILELFASFVYFDSNKNKYTDWQKDGDVYDAMPKMFIEFAQECRLGLGYRLLRRCLRHSFDSRTESLDNKKAKLILYNDKVGIHLSTPIPASMKKDVYEGDTVLTIDELLCSSCECMSGGDMKSKSSNSACVHTLARAYLLTLLLVEDLAEHMLLELSSILTSVDIEKDTWGKEQIDGMKQSILILMEASGDSTLAEDAKGITSLFEILESYRTGTQRQKQWNRVHSPPREEEICPIYELKFDSPEHKAKVKMNRASAKPDLDPTEEIVSFSPDYVRTGQVMNAAGINPSLFESIGFKLFERRRREQPYDPNNFEEEFNKAKAGWATLMEAAEKRSMRQAQAQRDNLKQSSKNRSQNLPTTPTLRRSSRKRISSIASDDSSPKKKVKTSGPTGYHPSKRCAKHNCPINSDNKPRGVTFHRIPKYPEDLPDDATLEQKIKHRGKLELRREVMERSGYMRDDQRNRELRICSCHPIEKFRRYLPVEHNGKTTYNTYEFTAISGAGGKSSAIPSNDSRGVGKDRFATQHLIDLQKKKERANAVTTPMHMPPAARETEVESERRRRKEAEIAKSVAEGQAAEAWLLAQQVVECHSPEAEGSPSSINPTVSKAAGLVQSEDAPEGHPHSKKLFCFRVLEKDDAAEENKAKSKSVTTKEASAPSKKKPAKKRKPNRSAGVPPTVTPAVEDNEVKRRTGFANLQMMYAYIILICNGDFDRMHRRKTSLTWLEEWFLYFEWTWHQTNRRQIDLEAAYGICHGSIRDVKDCKAALEMAALLSWPRFASFEEDSALRNQKKWSRYEGYRPIMWDMTNVSALQFSDASLQRATYSEYYGENCFKGGVFCQLCGWGGNEDLFGGGVSDTDYNKRAGYLKAQQDFQETDLVNGKVVKFLNILDRGYRAKMAAWQHGKQLALQPPSAKSDERFKGKETVYAGCIASDRSGNERGVNVSKRSGIMKRGFRAGMSAKRFNNAWRTWSFRANFMYKAVL